MTYMTSRLSSMCMLATWKVVRVRPPDVRELLVLHNVDAMPSSLDIVPLLPRNPEMMMASGVRMVVALTFSMRKRRSDKTLGMSMAVPLPSCGTLTSAPRSIFGSLKPGC